MTDYVYSMRLIAVSQVDYADDTSLDIQERLAEIVDDEITIARGGVAIGLSEWTRPFMLSVDLTAPASPLGEAILDAAHLRATELMHADAGPPVQLHVKPAEGKPVPALADFYCVPPRPPECYHAFKLLRDDAEIPVVIANGDEVGVLAELLTIRPLG